MKQINPSLYENLTARQRVIATIEAEARNDEEEVQRLIKSCPKITVRQNDSAYSDTLDMLIHVDILMQRNMLMMGMCHFFMLPRDEEVGNKFAQKAANMEAAWRQVIEEKGIDYDTFRKVALPLPPVLDWVIGNTYSKDAEDLEDVKEIKRELEKNFEQ